MNKLVIIVRKREVDLAEAVERATSDHMAEGQLEGMRATIENQNKMIARMLAVQFGQYEDHFSSPAFEPKTDADKLAFILGCTVVEG
jgi:hypothetical protein